MASSGALSRLFRNSTTRLSVAAPSPSKLPPPPPPGSSPIRRVDREAESAAASIFSAPEPHILVSLFKKASALPRFRAKHRVYEFAVRRLASLKLQSHVAEILEEQKQYVSDISREGFAARLITLYGVANMVEEAKETFFQLPSFGCTRSSLSFNALLSACSANGDLKEMDQLFVSVPREDPEIVPNVVSYNILVSSRCKSGELEEATRVLEIMEKEGVEPNIITFNTLLNGFYLAGRYSEAEKIWEMMVRKNYGPDLKSFNAKVRGLATAGRMEEALAIVEELPSLGFSPETSTFNALIKGYSVVGENENARKMFDDLPNKGCRANRESFEIVVPLLLKGGEIDGALSLCRESISRRCSVKGDIVKEVVEALVGSSRDLEAESLLKLSGMKVAEG